jgi:hypothetical protein
VRPDQNIPALFRKTPDAGMIIHAVRMLLIDLDCYVVKCLSIEIPRVASLEGWQSYGSG